MVNAQVRVRGVELPVNIAITGPDKPQLSESLRLKWQNLIDVMARTLGVPAGLVMQLDKDEIRVFLSSMTDGNPYSAGASESLTHGLYCETVVGRNRKLLVPDATESPLWADNPDIKLGMISYLGLPVRWPDGEFFGTICALDGKSNSYSRNYEELLTILRDGMEEDLRETVENYEELARAFSELEQSNRHLHDTLRKNEILLGEVHHRVKNNLQIISSLVQLQADTVEDRVVGDMLMTIYNRIGSMGAVHEILYQSDDFRTISVRDYIELLSSNVVRVLSPRDATPNLSVKIDPGVQTNIDTAVAVGLIVNELVTNAIKHAFPDPRSGKITIVFTDDGAGDFVLSVGDNGVGISRDEFEGAEGLGHELVLMLAKQLHGTIDVESNGGTTFQIHLQAVKKEDSRWDYES